MYVCLPPSRMYLHTLPTYIEGGISISVPASFTVLESSYLRYWLAQDLNPSCMGHCCRLTRALSPSQSLKSSVTSAFYLHQWRENVTDDAWWFVALVLFPR